DEAAGLLAQTRLLTVAGPGGMGKTRFALALAERVAGRFEDGVYFVELQPVSDAGLVPSAILEALSLREDPNRPIERTVVDHLSSRSALLVIDNCERVRDGCARIVERLLRACPRLRIVPTTRIVLSVPGETTFRLSSLQENDAVALFCERARAAVPAYELTPDDAGIIAGIVRKLDGIPLAVELAAARTRVMSLQTLDRRLEELMRETAAGGSRTQPTLRAALDWSYEYLSAQERMLFERLAVFAGSLTLEAAESVCGGDGLAAGNILDLLTVLVDNSLVQFERHGEATRFRYLDTVRAYALEKFAVSPARERIRAAHAHWFVSFVEGLEPKLYD
ncbi:MAG: AAA family ATPase, partial [Candidatus Eremiobacteraeota bacterium]|nr:AAA family ATPase [Candidatus Eremiobacteraeota bacterium]